MNVEVEGHRTRGRLRWKDKMKDDILEKGLREDERQQDVKD